MSRRNPKLAAAPAFVPESSRVEIRLTLRLATPVIGGGVEALAADRTTPVRVPSIRGQLRMWWRAVNPSGCKSLQELSCREAEVFGSAKGPDPEGRLSGDRRACRIWVEKQPGPPTEVTGKALAAKLKGDGQGILYGSFPLRNPGDHKDEGKPLFDYGRGSFKIGLSVPEHAREDILGALWAWLHFGGLGARTRRGFGAVVLDDRAGTDEWAALLAKRTWSDVVPERDVPWPHLRRSVGPVVARGTFKTALEAQAHLLAKLFELRQGAGTGRRKGQGKTPGRSYWPEPDAIRRATKQTSSKHREPVSRLDVYPRAAFGLPIVTHFKDGQDPGDTTLKLKDFDRLASPLILRPVLAGGKWRAQAVRLHHPPTGQHILRYKDKDKTKQVDVEVQLQPADARQVRPLNMDGQTFTDPIAAYLHLLHGAS